jgi:hypothetical protein
MPVPKNKPTTVTPEGSTPDPSSSVLPDPGEFRQHLRRLAVSAVQVLIEQVMREELEQCIGASCAEENKDGWSCLVQERRHLGAREVDLIVTDGHDGLLAAVSFLFPATLR